MSILFRLFSALVLALSVMATLAQSTFQNPVYKYDWPDPTVWQGDDGLFYSFSTSGTTYNNEHGKFLYSRDLVRWDTVADVAFNTDAIQRLHALGHYLWAPQVVKLRDKWLMYITCYEEASQSAIAVLSFDSPSFPTPDGKTGPWRFEGVLTDSRNTRIIDTIDPFVIEDPETGKVWLFFGSTGRNYRVELASDGLSLAHPSNPTYTHVAGNSVSYDGSRETVFEGVYLYYRAPYWYYFASSGLYSGFRYAIQVGRSTSLTGAFVDRRDSLMTQGYAEKILFTPNGSGDFWGPGHNAEIFTDAIGNTYMLYHSHAKAASSRIRRSLMLQQIRWDDDGWPYFTDSQPQLNERCPILDDYSYTLSVSSAQWATIYLPALFDIPEGMDVFEVRVSQDGQMMRTPASVILANHPYLVHAPAGEYLLKGHSTVGIDGMKYGDLVGNCTTATVPEGAFVLQNHNGRVGFYRVTNSTTSIPAHRAYLSIPSGVSAASIRDFVLDDEETGIESVTRDESASTVTQRFSMDGRELYKAPLSGTYLIRRADGSIQKVMLR